MNTERKLMIIGCIGFIAVGMANAALGVAWAEMRQTFGVSLDALGVLLGAVMFSRLVLSVISGQIISRIGVGTFMVAGSLLMTVGLLGYAVAPVWGLLILSGLVFGFGLTALNAGINTHAAAHYSPGRMNWLHAWFGIGSVLGPLLVTVVVTYMELNWRWLYVFFVVVQLTITAVFIITRDEWVLTNAQHTEQPKADIRATLRLTLLWFCLALFVLHGGIQTGVGQLTHSLLTEGRHIDAGTAGLWISIYWAGLAIGRMITGLVIARIGNDRFLRGSMFITVVATVLLWANISDVITFLAIVTIGFTLAPVIPLLLTDLPRRLGVQHAPNAVGLQVAFAGLGMSVLPGIAAYVAERDGLETISVYYIVVALLSFIGHEALLRYEQRKLNAHA